MGLWVRFEAVQEGRKCCQQGSIAPDAESLQVTVVSAGLPSHSGLVINCDNEDCMVSIVCSCVAGGRLTRMSTSVCHCGILQR